MATMVYEGNMRGGGTLFSGLKFFIMQRVPARLTWVEAVLNNGGEVVIIDKQADIIIADHARKDCPSGSTSWTFIEKSLGKGRLEDIENHPAGPTTHVVREVGSARPARSGRTPFTAQDDRELMIWVTKAEWQGISTKGNETFKQLEAINPRHTFQSWRDRWIKQLSGRPRPELTEEDMLAVGGPKGNKFSNHLPPTRRLRSPSPDVNEVMDMEPPASSKQDSKIQPRSSVSRVPTAKPKLPGSTSAPKPAVNKPKDTPTVAKAGPMLPAVRKSIGGMNFTDEEIHHMMDSYDVMEEADQSKGVKAWAKLATEHHSAQEWHNYFVQSIKPRMQKRQQTLESPILEVTAEPIEAPAAGKMLVDPSTEDEKLFIEDLTMLAEEHELELWQLVRSEEFGGYDEVEGRGMWTQVAAKLNFNHFKHTDAPEAIRLAYKEVLPDFEAIREEYMQEEDLIELQLLATAERDSEGEDPIHKEADGHGEGEGEEDDYDDDLEAPASVRRQQDLSYSSKRSFNNDRINQDGSPVLGSNTKRRRVDKGKGKQREIRSTPDDIVNVNPTTRSVYLSSPLKNKQNADEEGDRSRSELLSRPMKKQSLQTQRQTHRNLEPETQDFNFHFPSKEDDDPGSQTSLPSLPNHSKTRNITTAALESKPHEGSPTQSQTASQIDEALTAAMDQYIAFGYSQAIVIQALESTSMQTGNAAIVMEELSQGHGIPENIQGVWTALDDAALEDMESEAVERIAMKHGSKFIALRQRFLAHQKEARGELEEE